MTLERGTLLNNRYRIVDILGQGGMASIYRAIDENIGTEVAVKENLFTTEEYSRQFRREAIILASLRHPNLPRVTDHFEIEEQRQYLVMDYVEGEDLRQRLDRAGALPEDEAVALGIAICDALMYMHSRTPPVLHRDVKPGNVKITYAGQVFLVDFGLAKLVQDEKVTTTGARAMTPGYSPPEQYGMARTDHRTDIYALGATLYSALTNALPEDGLARAMEQCDLTPIRQYNPKVSRRLASVIEKSLEVRPEDRYQSAEEFREELINSRSPSRRRAPMVLAISPPPQGEQQDIFRTGSSQVIPINNPAALYDSTPIPGPVRTPISNSVIRSPSSIRRRRAKRVRAILLSIITVVVLSCLAVYIISPAWFQGLPAIIVMLSSPTPTATITPNTPVPVVIQFTSTASLTPSITPSATPQNTATSTPTATRTQTSTVSPTPTPVGSGAGQIAFVSDRTGIPQIWLMNADGTGLMQITDLQEGACQPTWSPDGTKLLFISPCSKNQESYPGSSMFIMNADGTNLTPLISVPGGDYDPAWSPDGLKIAFTSLRLDDKPKVCVMFLWDYTVQILAAEGSKNMQPAWSPDGRQIVFATNRNGPQQLWIMASDGSSKARFSSSGALSNSFPDWSPDGKAILFTQEKEAGSIPWLVAAAVDAEDSPGVRLYPDYAFPLREGKYSPDALLVVFEGWTEEGNRDIFTMFSSGSGLQRLTEDLATDFDPVWRPTVTK